MSLPWPDGQGVPIDFALANAKRIADSTELPLTVDFEVGGEGLHPPTLQAKRIQAIRRAVGDQLLICPHRPGPQDADA